MNLEIYKTEGGIGIRHKVKHLTVYYEDDTYIMRCLLFQNCMTTHWDLIEGEVCLAYDLHSQSGRPLDTCKGSISTEDFLKSLRDLDDIFSEFA